MLEEEKTLTKLVGSAAIAFYGSVVSGHQTSGCACFYFHHLKSKSLHNWHSGRTHCCHFPVPFMKIF